MVTRAVRHIFSLLIGAWFGLGALVPGLIAEEVAGGIRGSVYDQDVEVPLANARITIVEALLTAASDADGRFLFPRVPAGTYTLVVSKDGYSRATVPGVVVTDGQLAEVRADLTAEVVEMEEFVVRGFDLGGSDTEAGLLDVRQDTQALTDAISAEWIKRAGASTAAAALKLVVGTSVQEGKYVVIRGLSDRYTSTLLNGVRLPTADAEKRAVPLDQFPGAQIENITVYKSFTPDQQGDSTGGSVNIKTRALPQQRFLTLSGAIEYNTQATGNDKFLTYRGGGVNYFGIDGGDRKLPFRGSTVPAYEGASISATLGPERLGNALTLDQKTRAFQPVLGTSTKTAAANYSWSIAAGERTKLLGESELGVLGAFTYRQKYQFYEDGLRRNVTFSGVDVEPTIDADFHDTRGTEEVQWSASAGLGWQFNEDHQVGVTFTYNQTTQDDARFLEDSVSDPTRFEQSQSLRYNERALSSVQLRGDHELPDLLGIKIDWTGAHNTAAQSEPDQRFFFNYFDPATTNFFAAGPDIQHTLRIFREIDEDSRQAMLNVTVPYRQWTDTEGFIKFGPFVDHTHRDLRQDSFTYKFGYPRPGPLNLADFDNINLQQYSGPGLWTDVFLDPNRIGLATNGARAVNQLLWYVSPTDTDLDYTGRQVIEAGYAMAEVPLTSWLKVTGGARLEITDLEIDVDSPFDTVTILRRSDGGNFLLEPVPDAEAGSSLHEVHWLPSVAGMWQVITNLNLRASWSQTIARPTFRELAAVRTFEFLGGDQFVGNPELQISEIDNYDLRLEWFRRPGDLMAAGIFYKKIEDPIEQITFVAGGGNRFTSRVNYPRGIVYGVEGEFRQTLDIIHELLKDLTFGVNASLIESSVDLPEEERLGLQSIGIDSAERRLLGQPEYLFNVNLTYDNDRTGTSFGIFYTITGETLVSGEALAEGYIPNLYELRTDSLDVSFEQRLGKVWRLTLRAKNLTDPLIRRAYRVDWINEPIPQVEYRRGMDFSVGLTCSW
jgi:TonB-dependent receptor